MKIFDFTCNNCGVTKEYFVKDANSQPDVCKHCNTAIHGFKKCVPATAVETKGKGFYKEGHSPKTRTKKKDSSDSEE